MAHRLGIFLAATLILLSLWVAQPWNPGSATATFEIMRAGIIGAGLIYIVTRGFGWVMSGK